ncbi:MAG: hypothetical protein NTV34_09200 [Proteobacteria bacterium]|nr:hypothetical protein [Pseudomonadota bacterium]
MSNPSASDPNRPERFISHALVEVRRFKFLPFFVYSGILLDMSTAGFKAELTSNEARLKQGDLLWMHIPMSPLGIRGMKDLICKIDVRWFDAATARLGGIFVDLDPLANMLVDQIVSRLRENGNKIR